MRVRAGILAGITAPIVSWGLAFVVIATWPGYDAISQSISLLATAPLGWLQSAAFAIGGLLGLAWALALPLVLGAPDRPRDRAIVRALLLLQAGIAIGFAILPTDPVGVPVTTVGTLHLLDSYPYAVTMPLTPIALGLVMRHDPRWHGSVRAAALSSTRTVSRRKRAMADWQRRTIGNS